nr:hypothetical protein HK105_001703 [Polyrhizophydium stewartii]
MPAADAAMPASVLIEPPFEPALQWFDAKINGTQWFRSSRAALVLPAAWQAEIDATASAVLVGSGGVGWSGSATSVTVASKSDFNGNVRGPMSAWNDGNDYRLHILGGQSPSADREDSFTTVMQYGHAQLSEYSEGVNAITGGLELTGFDAATTLAAHERRGLGASLQAQVLRGGGQMRMTPLQFMNDGDATADALVDASLIGGLLGVQSCRVPATPATPSATSSAPSAATSAAAAPSATVAETAASTGGTATTAEASTAETSTAETSTGAAESTPPTPRPGAVGGAAPGAAGSGSTSTGAIAGGVVGAVGVAAAAVATLMYRRTAGLRMRAAAGGASGQTALSHMNPVFEGPVEHESPVFGKVSVAVAASMQSKNTVYVARKGEGLGEGRSQESLHQARGARSAGGSVGGSLASLASATSASLGSLLMSIFGAGPRRGAKSKTD